MKGIGAFNDYWTGRENLFLSFIIHLRAREDSIRKIIEEVNTNIIKYAEEHEQIANWLEELVMLRLDSCMIHMPERLQLVENGYNKALNDFVNVCEKQFTTMYGQRYVDMRDIVNIAEQLKAGGNS